MITYSIHFLYLNTYSLLILNSLFLFLRFLIEAVTVTYILIYLRSERYGRTDGITEFILFLILDQIAGQWLFFLLVFSLFLSLRTAGWDSLIVWLSSFLGYSYQLLIYLHKLLDLRYWTCIFILFCLWSYVMKTIVVHIKVVDDLMFQSSGQRLILDNGYRILQLSVKVRVSRSYRNWSFYNVLNYKICVCVFTVVCIDMVLFLPKPICYNVIMIVPVIIILFVIINDFTR